MEEENKDLNESVPGRVYISKKAGIALGLFLGFFLEVVAFFCLMSAPGGIVILFFLYIALIILFYVKGRNSIGLGLILAFSISLLIFGGCLALLTLP